MPRIYWVDNVNGDDLYDGRSYEFSFATIDEAIDQVNTQGVPGDIIRICYTGTDYAYVSRSYISTTTTTGSGWGENEYFKVEGYDPSGGNNRPKLGQPSGASTGYPLVFSIYANYWEISELWFESEGANTTYNSGGINLNNSLLNSSTYFKVRRCRFDGSYFQDAAIHDQGIYATGGSRVHLDVQYCFFKDLRFPIINANIDPRNTKLVSKNNIFYFTGWSGDLQLYYSNTGEEVDITHSNNTWLSLGDAKNHGVAFRMVEGDLTTGTNLNLSNNFTFWVNIAYRHAGGVVDDDMTTNVGYNTWGGTANTSFGYYGTFDLFETEADYQAYGDNKVYDGYTQADYTVFFKGYNDWTYFWPESGWMTIPDLRPISPDLTGTREDVNGIRGAIEHSGIYVDASVSVINYATVTDNTDAIITNHNCLIDKTEFYSDTAQIFWDTSDVSLVTDVTTAENIYSGNMRDNFCLFPEQTSGYLKIKRDATALYEGVDGTVTIDTTLYSTNLSQHLSIYFSANDTSAGTLLGSVYSYDNKSGIVQKTFSVPAVLMQTISDSSFAGMTLGVYNDYTSESRWQIYDSMFTYTPLTKAELDTTHSAEVAGATTPIIWKSLGTPHKARIKRGAYYVLEYYTKNNWWDL